jgi:hypothetical protein
LSGNISHAVDTSPRESAGTASETTSDKADTDFSEAERSRVKADALSMDQVSVDEIANVLTKLPPAPENKAVPAVPVLPIASSSPTESSPGVSSTIKPATSQAQVSIPTPALSPPIALSTARYGKLRDIARELKLPLPLPNGRVVIYKKQRRLELWSGKTIIKAYRVALGSAPQGHKQLQGDGKTPEGEFFICTRNDKTSAFHIFLGLSYPALPDATRGVRSKAITWREYQVIRQRLASRAAPLWRTRLGGWVGIHGGTGQPFANRMTKARKTADWTAGCIALTNVEIEEIHTATKFGTPVSVRP